jgi:hypothetical protein
MQKAEPWTTVDNMFGEGHTHFTLKILVKMLKNKIVTATKD